MVPNHRGAASRFQCQADARCFPPTDPPRSSNVKPGAGQRWRPRASPRLPVHARLLVEWHMRQRAQTVAVRRLWEHVGGSTDRFGVTEVCPRVGPRHKARQTTVSDAACAISFIVPRQSNVCIATVCQQPRHARPCWASRFACCPTDTAVPMPGQAARGSPGTYPNAFANSSRFFRKTTGRVDSRRMLRCVSSMTADQYLTSRCFTNARLKGKKSLLAIRLAG